MVVYTGRVWHYLSNTEAGAAQCNYYYCYYDYYIHLAAFFQDNLGKPAPERQTILDFTGWVAEASAGPYADHLHLAPDR